MASAGVVFLAYQREGLARRIAESQQRAALENLSRAYLEKAERLLEDRAHGSARVYAAQAALQAEQAEALDPAFETAVRSALYRAVVRQRFVLDKLLPTDLGAPLFLAYASDGGHVAGVTPSGRVLVWSTSKDDRPVQLASMTVPTALRFSRDGRGLYVATGSGELALFDIESTVRKKRWSLGGLIVSADVSPDETLLATVSTDRQVRLHRLDRESEPELLTLGTAARFSKDGRSIAIGGDGIIRVLDLATRKETAVFRPGLGIIWRIAFGGRYMAASRPFTTFVFDLTDNTKIGEVESDVIRSLELSPDGELLLISGSAQTKVWSTRSRRIEDVVVGAQGGITSARFSSDGRQMITAGHEAGVRIWKRSDASQSLDVDSGITTIATSKHGELLLSGLENGEVILFEGDSWERRSVLTKLERFVMDIGFSPDESELLTLDIFGHLRIFDTQTRELLRATALTKKRWPFETKFWGATYSPDGKWIATTSLDHRIKILDAKDLEPRRQLTMRAFQTQVVRFSPDGKHLVATDMAGRVGVFDAQNDFAFLGRYGGHRGVVSGLSIAKDSKRFATSAMDGTILVWQFDALGRPPILLEGHDKWVNRIEFSPDGKLLLSVSDDYTARVWDLEHSREHLRLPLEAQGLGVAFSPKGDRMFIGNRRRLEILPVTADPLGRPAAMLVSEAERATGQRLEGSELRSQLRRLAEFSPSKSMSAGPRDTAGIVMRMNTGAPVVGAKLTAVDPKTGIVWPGAPEAESDDQGRFRLRFPEGAQSIGLRVEHDGASSYRFADELRPGVDNQIVQHAGPDAVRLYTSRVGLKPDPKTGQASIALGFRNPDAPRERNTAVGCAEIEESSGARPYLAETLLRLPSKAEALHPGAPIAWFFNLTPGLHTFRARIGAHTAQVTVPIFEGSFTDASLYFEGQTNPTPADCFVSETDNSRDEATPPKRSPSKVRAP